MLSLAKKGEEHRENFKSFSPHLACHFQSLGHDIFHGGSFSWNHLGRKKKKRPSLFPQDISSMLSCSHNCFWSVFHFRLNLLWSSRPMLKKGHGDKFGGKGGWVQTEPPDFLLCLKSRVSLKINIRSSFEDPLKNSMASSFSALCRRSPHLQRRRSRWKSWKVGPFAGF